MSTATATKKKSSEKQRPKTSALAKPPAKAKSIERRELPPKPGPRSIAAAPPEPAAVNTDLVHEVPHAIGSVWREPRKNIRRSSTNPRTVFELDDLITTLRSQGQLVPIIVRFRPDTESDTDYEIIDGESRDRAFERLEWPDIEVKLVEMSDEQVEEVQLVTTLSRADLKPLDEAHAFERLERKGYSIAQISDRVGKPQSYIRQRLALARLTDEAKAALRDGQISVGAAQELASVTDPTAQRRIVARALEARAPGADPLTAKQIRMYIEPEMLVLSRAKFSLDDAALVPSAGACATCPKRSSQQFALIALPGVSDEERCTDRSCFVAKQEAHWTRSAEAAREAGQTVIEGDAARKVIAFDRVAKDSGYVDIDAHCAELCDGRTWSDVLGDAPLPRALVRGAEGATHVVVPKADAVRVLRERGLLRTPGHAAEPPKPANDATTERDPQSEPADGEDTGPDTVPPSAPEPTLLSVDQIARAAKRARLDGATFAALMEAAIVALEPADVEVAAICKPYDVPVPPDVEGHDVVIGVARGIKNDGERLALLARVCCAISQKARERLSEHFAPKPGDVDTAIEAAKVRALHAIRTGARKPAQIRSAAGIDESAWAKLAPALESSGLVRVEGRTRGREYFIVDDVTIDAPPADPETTATEAPDGLPAAESSEIATSEVEQSIRDNVRDLLRSHALQRAELASQLADIEAISETDADSEIEQLLREGFLFDNGECVEWVADRTTRAPEQGTLFADAPRAADAPRPVF